MKRLFTVLAFALFAGVAGPDARLLAQTAPGRGAVVQNVDAAGAKALVTKKPVVVLDVRTPQEFAGGHLKQALNLNYNAPDFAAQLARLDKAKPYLVYCAVGGRSSKAVQMMRELGFKQVYNATEGYAALKQAGLSVAE